MIEEKAAYLLRSLLICMKADLNLAVHFCDLLDTAVCAEVHASHDSQPEFAKLLFAIRLLEGKDLLKWVCAWPLLGWKCSAAILLQRSGRHDVRILELRISVRAEVTSVADCCRRSLL